MTNKNFSTVFLHVCVASFLTATQTHLAYGAAQGEVEPDLEVGATPASSPPTRSETAPPAAAAASAIAAPVSLAPAPAGSSSPVPPAVSSSAPASLRSDGAPIGAATPQPAASAAGLPASGDASRAEAIPKVPSASTAAAPTAAPGETAKVSETGLIQQLGQGLRLSGYFQAQYESHQDSQDQLNQSGGLLNQDRFVLRRGRVRVGRDWDYAALLVEFDGNTVKGPGFRWQKAEASLVYGRSKDKDVWPALQFTMGMFDLPFGYELVESPKSRPFMERSTGGRALWPSEPDVGARLMGQTSFLRYTVALTNGEPLDEKSGLGLQDPNKNKDITVRLGAVTKPWPRVIASGDVSYNAGKGFHPGTPAAKASTTWHDDNHNGQVDQNELTGNPPSAATPSSNFSRWALGADAQFVFETRLGKSTIYGEVILAQNLDRGLFISDPAAIGGQNIRQLNYYVGIIQEITAYGLIGFRADYYNPNADITESRGGKLLPVSQVIRNYSPLIGLVLPERAKLLFQYDIQTNLLGRDSRGVPTHYPNNTATLRLQVNL